MAQFGMVGCYPYHLTFLASQGRFVQLNVFSCALVSSSVDTNERRDWLDVTASGKRSRRRNGLESGRGEHCETMSNCTFLQWAENY